MTGKPIGAIIWAAMLFFVIMLLFALLLALLPGVRPLPALEGHVAQTLDR